MAVNKTTMGFALNINAKPIKEPIIIISRMFIHERVRDDTPFINELQAFPQPRAMDDCIDATAEAINHLPNLSVDVSKVAKIFNPLSTAGSSFKINKWPFQINN